jgi:hypothetical protein
MAVLVALALAVAATAQAQLLMPFEQQPKPQPPRHYYRHDHREAEPAPPPPPSVDKRDSMVAAAGAFNGRPYWLALAQCGGIYFKLDVLYTDAAVRARVVKPDPKANAELTRKLNEAINTATAYFDSAEHFLMSERGVERTDAVLTYDAYSRAAGEPLKAIAAALAATNSCPALYHACQAAFPKECNEPLGPTG